MKEALCDGLGACLGHCPENALIIEERESTLVVGANAEVRVDEFGFVWVEMG